MKIIIEVPDEYIIRTKENGADTIALDKIAVHGVQIPNNCGRLIDLDALENADCWESIDDLLDYLDSAPVIYDPNNNKRLE